MDENALNKLPPVARISAERFGGNTFIQEQVITVDNVAMTRLANNPNRANWIISNEGTNDVRVSNLPNISSISGWLLPAAGGVLSMDWFTDGEGVTYEIYLISITAPVNVRIREVIRL